MANTLELTPELQYEIVIAALELVGGVSSGVHARIERAVRLGQATSYPGVRPRDLVALREVLNRIEPGGLADETIGIEERRRAARRNPDA